MQDIDIRLKQIADNLLLNASFIDSPGLLNGKMGIAIFLYNYSKYSGNKVFGEYAGELIDQIYEEININTTVNFETGLTGIGWGIEYLVKNKFVQADTDEALSEIDNSVYRNSLYRPFPLDSGIEVFGYGLYYISRLRENGTDDNNLNTLFKKQHLIYLTDDCERILVQKMNTAFKINSLSIDTINSFIWFLLEMDRWGIVPFKVQKIFLSLPEYIEPLLKENGKPASKIQLIKLVEHMVRSVLDINLKEKLRDIIISFSGINKAFKMTDESLFRNYNQGVWQNLIYDPYTPAFNRMVPDSERVLQIIENKDNWNRLINDLNKDTLGLAGFAGIGLGLLFAKKRQPVNNQ